MLRNWHVSIMCSIDCPRELFRPGPQRCSELQAKVSGEVMASQPTPSVSFTVAEFNSFIRGYHAYRDIWIPVQGEVLILRREPTNEKDKSAVAIHKEGDVVGHVPYNISSLLSNFLTREYNKGFVEVTGCHVNRGAGYGLEVPYIYRLYGPRAYIEKIHEVVQTLLNNGLL